MNLPALSPSVEIVNGKIVTTSLKIAEHFGKRHDNVIRNIENLECSEEFTHLNFEASEYTDTTGRKLPAYTITRDGFMFLAMGFTGKEAAQWKEAYILAFNKLEAAQHQTAQPEPETPQGQYHYPKKLWQPKNKIGQTAWITYDELNRMNDTRPLAELLKQLKADGNNIEAAQIEYDAIKLLLESVYWKLQDTLKSLNESQVRGLRVMF